ncbi:DUF3298 and DUF4163 domain-containing protein [Peribacillus loiseleuriae]|uniref:Deacetylase PdaC domain-containing protein n=1 Tax=Peribacillus loiseleuriae TaxID=1679170 RepID=A0A0K9GTE0_9BACI|nr:DUF3298 and DUF4163 domain-containing protein [Peribacillus loiseleuriae]KMY49896.1 hypothetical protein AC625_10460 [Peribacillus loiseleuriae]
MRNPFVLRALVLMIIFFLMNFFALPSAKSYANSPIKVITHTYNGIKFLTYPQVTDLKNKSAQKKINAMLEKHIQNSHNDYQKLKESMKKIQGEPLCNEAPSACQYEYNSIYKVLYNKDHKISILMNDYQFSGGAHGNTIVTTYNFNTDNGKQYRLDDIITKESIYAKITTYAKEYIKMHPDVFFTDNDTLNAFQVTKDHAFYFVDGGIALIFQSYEVAPYSSGQPVIVIPTSIYK